jgi:DNA modification methylase
MKNKLFYGDNLEVLRKYVADESIDLCYIDPPFNSKRNYNQIYNNVGKDDKAQAQAFIDTWIWDSRAEEGLMQILSNEGNRFTRQTIKLIAGFREVLDKGSLLAYLVSMTLRTVEIHRALKSTGSFYLHCDPTASHYLKILLDSIFVQRGGDYKNEIVWEKTRVPKAQSKHFAKQQDVILYYTKSDEYLFNYEYRQPTTDYIKKYFSQIEPETNRRYQLVSFLQDGSGKARIFGDRVIAPPKGKHWIWSQEKIDEAMRKDLLVFTHPDKPRLKKYLDEQVGKNIGTIWNDIPPINSQAKERLGYPTQKPESLLERIIGASSKEGDTVLDAYCGCGTTIAVAEKMGRNWIGIDITYQSISLILKRLEDSFGVDFTKEVVDRETKIVKIPAQVALNGVPQDMESAVALANRQDDRLRKEFEKWVILTYSNNRAIINEKKRADKGIDGTALILHNIKQEIKEVIFSVKSGNLNLTQIRDLLGVITRENAAIGILLTLEEPSKNMLAECKQAGTYENELTGQKFDKLQIVTVKEVLEGKRLSLPMNLEVLKSAELKILNNEQKTIFE